ncbi:MAG: ABC transporter ATP-binding protein [Phycisphaerae bacterium]
MTGIRLDNMAKVYGSGGSAVRAVDDVNLSIETGEFFFLLGPSGCGKTTLLRMIAGLIDPTGGRLLFGERDVTHLSVEDRQTAMVFQNYALWPHMSVWANVEFGPKMRGKNADQRRALAGENLARVEMQDFGRRKPNQLSGGQQQRVALARALAAQPQCLLLDEPLSNLDARLRLHMRGQLRQMVKSTGTTAVYVTHDQKEALSMADRIAVMNGGKIVQVGAPEQVYNRPANRFVADFVGEANFIEGKVALEGGKARDFAGGARRIDTPVGTLFTADERCGPAGSKITCCIRPERVGLSATGPTPQADPAAAAVPATVVSSTYLGEIRQYLCRLGTGDTWRISSLADRNKAFDAGTPVMLRIAASDVAVIPD